MGNFRWPAQTRLAGLMASDTMAKFPRVGSANGIPIPIATPPGTHMQTCCLATINYFVRQNIPIVNGSGAIWHITQHHITRLFIYNWFGQDQFFTIVPHCPGRARNPRRHPHRAWHPFGANPCMWGSCHISTSLRPTGNQRGTNKPTPQPMTTPPRHDSITTPCRDDLDRIPVKWPY